MKPELLYIAVKLGVDMTMMKSAIYIHEFVNVPILFMSLIVALVFIHLFIDDVTLDLSLAFFHTNCQ